MAYLMIVEDDKDSADALSACLRGAGHEVQALPNGKEALSSILLRLPDLLILDVYMPEMDGPSLLEVLRSYLRLASLPVIVLTGLPDSPLVERARHLKVNTVLVKGRASLEDMLEAVTRELPRAPG